MAVVWSMDGSLVDRLKMERRRSMTNQEAIKYLQQIYPNGGHCWLDEQRIEAIDMAVKALKEEPVSEDLKTELNKYIKDNFTIDKEQLDRFGIEEKDYMYSMDKSDMLALVEHFTNWQKTKDESTTEDLGECINKLSKQFPEVSFAKLSRIAVRVAKWQKQQDQSTIELAEDHAMLAGMEKMKEQMTKDIWKPADGDDMKDKT